MPEAQKVIDEIKHDSFKLASMSGEHPDAVKAIQNGDVKGLAKVMHSDRVKKIKELK